MKLYARLLFSMWLLLLSACQTLDRNVMNAIAGCSAGYDHEFSSRIEAEIKEAGGVVGASLNEGIQGVFVSDPRFSGEQALQAHDQYMRCYTRYVQTGEDRYEKLKAEQVQKCEIQLQCDLNKTEGLCVCRTTLEEIAEERGLSDQEVARLYFEKCNPGGMRLCWNESEDITLQRSRCEIVLSDAGREVPSVESGSCLQQSNQ